MNRYPHQAFAAMALAALMCAAAAQPDDECVSVRSLCRRNGISCAQDKGAIRCSTATRGIIVFGAGWFCLVNDSLRQMSRPAVERNNEICLDAGVCAGMLGCTPPVPLHQADSTRQAVPDTARAAASRTVPARTDSAALRPAARADSAASHTFATPKKSGGFKTIVLDPGHGGKDPGAIGPDGTHEKDIVLAVGLKLRDQLIKRTGATVLMTRDNDTFIPLNMRTKFANEKKADIFISLHVNSITKAKRDVTRGFKIYFLSPAKNEDDRIVEMQENAVIELEDESDKGKYLQNLLIDLAGNEHLTESQDMSIMLSETFEKELKKIDKLHLGVGQANFYVLHGAYMPAVLIEMGFISNPDEEKLLVDEKMQVTLAAAIAEAIAAFQEKYEVNNE
jgi:N-acetylmuramoyl-L-alanine amidase